MTYTVYIGGSTSDGSQGMRGAGILVCLMEGDSGRLELIQEVDSEQEPSFLALHPNRRSLYAVNEVNQGMAAAFSIDPSSGRLTFLNRQPLGAPGPCYVAVSPDGRWLVTANYSGGSLSVLPIGPDGRLGAKNQVVQHTGSSASAQPYSARDEQRQLAEVAAHATGQGVLPDRQEKAHAHCAIFDAEQRYLLAADLGMDRVWVYRFDSAAGRVLPVEAGQPGGLNTPAGAGPRHLAFHPNGKYLYLANELDSTVMALAWDGQTGGLSPLQHLSTLPAGFQGESWAADIHLTPDGRFLYVSNRGDDSLACFAVDDASGRLSPQGHYATGGRWPRNFGITPDGQFLLAANQHGDSVVVWRIDSETGALAATGSVLEAPAPMFACAVDLEDARG